jgi:hypothetical protein
VRSGTWNCRARGRIAEILASASVECEFDFMALCAHRSRGCTVLVAVPLHESVLDRAPSWQMPSPSLLTENEMVDVEVSEKDADEGIVVDDDDDSRDHLPSIDREQDESSERTSTAAARLNCGNLLGDLSLFRDFFMVAFSDGYSNVSAHLDDR